jgi:hypothetical protein
MQALEVIGRRITDRRIETAFALARGQSVPKAEAMREMARQAVRIRQRIQLFADQGADHFPELVDVLVNLRLSTYKPPCA